MCDSASAAAEPTIIDLASLAGGLKLKNIKVKAMARTAAENPLSVPSLRPYVFFLFS